VVIPIITFTIWGLLVAGFSIILYVTFDARFKKTILTLLDAGGSLGFLGLLHSYFGITSYSEKMVTAIAFVASFVLTFCGLLYFVCQLIKDRDDADIIRFRDILLGQKDYITKYYEMRKKQIDDKLQISKLEQRERAVAYREKICNEEESRLLDISNSLTKQTKKKIYIKLPENKRILLSTTYPNISIKFEKSVKYID